ncbi:NAD(P)-binding protein [Schizophyllum commune H4-8]|uniref:NAD(P)-binding protein n=1 Tax=Schizophyllum commune (strain H4-8 / FGSC 9210) TaxID=578458 RepID=D8PKJ3_SCHCM|nr:NAD(P)-binding protein [Schizophyllum commune H4-8]KAI5894185.1 NAD(P)-binding protein [Schizophyllum commune H4-8]
MPPTPFALVTPATRGLSLALARQLLQTTNLPLFATHRSGTGDELKQHVLAPLKDVDPARLHPLQLDLTDEASIESAAQTLADTLPSDAYLDTAFFTGGVLHPEKQPADLDLWKITESFQINTISHLLMIKHFARFVPPAVKNKEDIPLSKWVHVSARVGSISDNRSGGWYSYRASKAALNQVIRTWDWQLRMQKKPVICVGVHPGTMKTELSRAYWESTAKEKLFDPEYSAQKLVEVVKNLKQDQRGKVWDYKGEEVLP